MFGSKDSQVILIISNIDHLKKSGDNLRTSKPMTLSAAVFEGRMSILLVLNESFYRPYNVFVVRP